MNYILLFTNILTFLAFIAHTFVGDKEIRMIYENLNSTNPTLQEKWTMSRGGWHWVSFDLLYTTIGLGLINFSNIIPYEMFLLKIIMIYFLGTGSFWLVGVLISPYFKNSLLKLGQWALCWLIALLILFSL